jgi:4-amino-4-deoxy-L-arabinose transferase-like glycosyltransferase
MPGYWFKKIHLSPDFILSSFLFLFTFVIAGTFSRIGIDVRHDGAMLKPALDVARGFMLYRDTFTQYGPLTSLVQAGTLLLFGKFLLTLKLLTAAFYGGIAVLQYLLYKRILPRSIAITTVILWVFCAPYFYWAYPFLIWSSVYALFFQLVAVYLLFCWLEKKQHLFLFYAGVATACVLYTRQTVGVFTTCSIIAFFITLYLLKKQSLSQAGKAFFNFLLGMITVSLFFAIWLGVNQGFSDWWKQSFVLGFLNGTQFTSLGDLLNLLKITLFPLSDPNFITSPVELWVLLPCASIIVFVQYYFFRKKDSQNHRLLVILLSLIGLSSWGQYYPIIDYRHVYWGGTPMFGLLALFCYELIRYIFSIFRKHASSLTTIITIAGLCLLFYPDVSNRIIQGKEKLSSPRETLVYPTVLQGIQVTREEKQYILDFENSLNTYFINHPDGTVVNLSGDGLYPALYDHMTYIPPLYLYATQFFGSIYPDFLPRMSTYIAVHHPLVVTSPTSVLPLGYCQLKGLDPVYRAYLALPCDDLYGINP